jgi:hypothetical protein
MLIQYAIGRSHMTNAADKIMQGLREAATHARGRKVPGLKLHAPRNANGSTLRGQTSQPRSAPSRRMAAKKP